VDLAASGFELLGGRVERVGARETAVVVYLVRKHPIDVFAWRDPAPDAAARTSTVRGFSVVRWNAGGLGFAAVSDLNAAELERFAQLLARGPDSR
jgi:anti-sigma factor RsiW